MKRNNSLIALSLGMLCALGPLGTDMYLGAMPDMANTLNATAAEIQLSVMSFFSGFTLGQLFYGPISDRTGRKPMIYLALAVFFLASLGCLFSTSGSMLLAWRFLQGLGGSIGMCSKCYASRWKPGASPFPAPPARPTSRPVSN